jgi:uncharacterized cupin superfamily protein
MSFVEGLIKSINPKSVVLDPLPIREEVLEGSPTAAIKVLWESEDKSCVTAVWSCTIGRWEIDWEWDEMMYIIEGESELADQFGHSQAFAAGDFSC